MNWVVSQFCGWWVYWVNERVVTSDFIFSRDVIKLKSGCYLNKRHNKHWCGWIVSIESSTIRCNNLEMFRGVKPACISTVKVTTYHWYVHNIWTACAIAHVWHSKQVLLRSLIRPFSYRVLTSISSPICVVCRLLFRCWNLSSISKTLLLSMTRWRMDTSR